MKKYLSLFLFIISLAFTIRPAHAANAMVGNGTPASCTEAAFDAAIVTAHIGGGGTIVFNCGNAPHTIDIYTPATISGYITIIGQDLITLAAQGTAPNYTRPRFFEIVEGGQLWMQDITLTGARSPLGAGWGSQGGSIVLWDDGLDIDTTLTLSGVTILNSASSAWGGAIANEGGAVLLENSYIEGTARWGGAYNGANGYEQFDNLTVSNSTSIEGGGALRFWDSKQVQITNSILSGNSTDGAGGAIENIGGKLSVRTSYIEYNQADLRGGGISQRNNSATNTPATLLLENLSVFGNTTLGDGGGIDNSTTLVVRNTTLSQNSAVRGGGIYNWGGTLTLEGVTLERNAADNGAGLYQREGGAILQNITASENLANYAGGGLYLDTVLGASSANWVTIIASRILSNSAGQNGSGIFANSAYFTLTNSEVAFNQRGGIYLWKSAGQVVGSYLLTSQTSVHDNLDHGVYQGQSSYLSMVNSTVSQNGTWGIWIGTDSTATLLKFSTLRGNANGQLNRTGGNALEVQYSAIDSGGLAVPNCSLAGGLPAPSVLGSYANDASCGAYVSNQLLLGALALNGGSTPNHLPQAGSDLISRISAVFCLSNDQRGATRESNPVLQCDVGAVEATNLFPRIYLPIVIR